MRIQALIVISLILVFAVRSLPMDRVTGLLFGVMHSDMPTEAAEAGGEGWDESPEFRETEGMGFVRRGLLKEHGTNSCRFRQGHLFHDRGADDIPTPPPDLLG